MEIYRLAKLVAKFLSISQEFGDFYFTPMPPPFSSSNETFLFFIENLLNKSSCVQLEW